MLLVVLAYWMMVSHWDFVLCCDCYDLVSDTVWSLEQPQKCGPSGHSCVNYVLLLYVYTYIYNVDWLLGLWFMIWCKVFFHELQSDWLYDWWAGRQVMIKKWETFLLNWTHLTLVEHHKTPTVYVFLTKTYLFLSLSMITQWTAWGKKSIGMIVPPKQNNGWIIVFQLSNLVSTIPVTP